MSASRAESLELDIPDVMLNNVAAELAVSGAQPGSSVQLSVGDREYQALAGVDGRATFAEVVVPDTGAVAVRASGSGGAVAAASLRVIPAWISIAPPLIAIAIALTLRNVIPALLIGIWFGATAIRGFSPAGMFHGLLDSFAVFVTTALLDPNRVAIILFSLMIGGMVGIITRNGGMASVVQLIVSRARTAAGGQVSVWLMGLMIFFDDYSNTLVVGNTARPMTDHLQISREKLAYIVDSTAAPVVCLALITTWIGYEVGLIDAAISSLRASRNRRIRYSCTPSLTCSIPYSRSFSCLLLRTAGATWGQCTKPKYGRATVPCRQSKPTRCRRWRGIRSMQKRIFRCAPSTRSYRCWY
jgi:hypothetical protein